MIALPSFLAALDKPQPKPASGESDTRETAENPANDGFATLIAQLIQIIPATNEPKAGRDQPAEGEAGNLPTGKILPVDGPKLAAVTANQTEGDALASVSPLVPPAIPANSSATIISFQQAQAAAQVAKQAEPAGQVGTDGDLPQAPFKEGAVTQPAPRADQIRLTVSVAPADAAPLRGAAPQDGAVPVEKQLTQALVPQSGEPKQSGRDPQAQTPAVAERAQPARVAAPEKEFGAAERLALTTADTTAKPGAMPVAAAAEAAVPSRSEGARITAPAPVAALTSVESIERLVERLSIAREFDMSKPASIAVTHREFGALTVTFDNARSGLDVEIAAKDNDMQRALAQAVAADRPASRAGEPLQQAQQPGSLTATSTGSERGAGSAGQGASSSGAGSSEGDRPQHQRDRGSMSSSQDPRNSAAPSAGDDALYA